MACWSGPSRIPGRGAPSRATSATTPVTSGCSGLRTWCTTSPDVPQRGSSWTGGASFAKATRPTSCSSTRRPSGTKPPSRTPGSLLPESTMCSSTARQRSTTASPRAPGPAVPCAAPRKEPPKPMTPEDFVRRLEADRTLAGVRADSTPAAADLSQALADGGIRAVELTFTTPDVLKHIRRAAETADRHGAVVGVGTVLTADQARQAIDAGAHFLVTPGIRPEVADVAVAAGIPFSLGA